MLRVLTDRRLIAAAAKAFRARIEHGERLRRIVGYQGGSEELSVYWHDQARVWGTQVRWPNTTRHWQAFGLEDPHELSRLNIAVEVNPPVAGIDRGIAGLFVAEGRAVSLGHRGNRINQVPKEEFRRLFTPGRAGQWVRVLDGHERREIVLLGRIDEIDTIKTIGFFSREVQRIKRLVRA